MDPNSSVTTEEPASWDELYNIDLVPSELFLKFRKEVEGFRLGVNLEVFYPFIWSLNLLNLCVNLNYLSIKLNQAHILVHCMVLFIELL